MSPSGSSETAQRTTANGSRDPRYLQFIKALDVVRGATGDEELDENRREELTKEAPEIFQLFDGTPSPVEPVTVAPTASNAPLGTEQTAA